MLPCFEIIEASVENKTENRFFVTDRFRFWTRTCQVFVVSLLGYLIPEFGSINAIIGSFTAVIVSQLLPAILHLVVFKKSQGWWLFIEDCLIIAVFTVVLFLCTGLSIADLVRKMKN